MRIAFVSNSANPGVLNFRKSLILQLIRLGHEVICFVPQNEAHAETEITRLGAVPVFYSLDRKSLSIVDGVRTVNDLRKKIKAMNPDLVFSFFLKPSFYGTLAAYLAGIRPRIAMIEGLGYVYTPGVDNKNKILKFFIRAIHRPICHFTYLLASKIVFLNKDDLADYLGILKNFKKKCVILGPIGLDLSTVVTPIKLNVGNSIEFLFVGRLLYDKGLCEFMRAARELNGENEDVKFTIVGDVDFGNPASLSYNDYENIKASSFLNYLGPKKSVMPYYQSADVFVLPSWREGYPKSTQEAMASGCAIITTDVPGCRETVTENINGLLVPIKNWVLLSEAMKKLIKDKKLIKQMKIASMKRANLEYDSNITDHKLIQLMSDTIGINLG